MQDIKLVSHRSEKTRFIYEYLFTRCIRVTSRTEIEFSCGTWLSEIRIYQEPELEDRKRYEEEFKKCVEEEMHKLTGELLRLSSEEADIIVRGEPVQAGSAICILPVIYVIMKKEDHELKAEELAKKAIDILKTLTA